MIPTPSKKPFGYPLPAEALPFLTRPGRGHKFERPFLDAGRNVVAWNGALAVRIRTFLPDHLDLAATPWEAIENSLHWPDPEHEKANPDKWRTLDDVAGDIWRFPPRSAWIACRDGIKGNTLSTVRVGAIRIVPLALLQLCARLPRCRVRIDDGPAAHLQFLFNGGEAVIKPFPDLAAVAPSFGIFTPSRHKTLYR